MAPAELHAQNEGAGVRAVRHYEGASADRQELPGGRDGRKGVVLHGRPEVQQSLGPRPGCTELFKWHLLV